MQQLKSLLDFMKSYIFSFTVQWTVLFYAFVV